MQEDAVSLSVSIQLACTQLLLDSTMLAIPKTMLTTGWIKTIILLWWYAKILLLGKNSRFHMGRIWADWPYICVMGLGAGVSFARGGQMMGWQFLRSSGDSVWLPSGYLKTFPDSSGCAGYLRRRSVRVFAHFTICLQNTIRLKIVKHLYLFNQGDSGSGIFRHHRSER